MTPDFDFTLDGLPPLHELGIARLTPGVDGVWKVHVDATPYISWYDWRVVFESHDEDTARAAREEIRRIITAAKLMVQP